MNDEVTISLDEDTKDLLSQINLRLKDISHHVGLNEQVQIAIINIEKHLARIANKIK